MAGLSEAHSDGVPAYLETATAANVALYERSGWTLHADLPDVFGLHIRVMRHPR
jgi:hypothetical protein